MYIVKLRIKIEICTHMLFPIIYESSKTFRVYWGHCAVRKSEKCSNFPHDLMLPLYEFRPTDSGSGSYMNIENVILNFHENDIWKIPMRN